MLSAAVAGSRFTVAWRRPRSACTDRVSTATISNRWASNIPWSRAPLREGVTRDLGLTRGAESRPFDESDRALMSRLIPHVERAFAINGALETKLAEVRQAVYLQKADRLLLQKMFELTPAQAQLAALLFEGASVKQAAACLGITEGSARQYLRRIFVKTGTNRQHHLVREIARAMARNRT